jgi:hypothetical protein
MRHKGRHRHGHRNLDWSDSHYIYGRLDHHFLDNWTLLEMNIVALVGNMDLAKLAARLGSLWFRKTALVAVGTQARVHNAILGLGQRLT